MYQVKFCKTKKQNLKLKFYPPESVRKQKASLLANSVVSSNTKLRSASEEKAPVKYEFDMSFMEQVATEELGSPRNETEQVVEEQVEQEDESYEKGESMYLFSHNFA